MTDVMLGALHLTLVEDGGLLDLLDWRRSVAEMYGDVRRSAGGASAWQEFRARRDQLFRSHAQSPLEDAQREAFRSLDYFPYDPAWRLHGRVVPVSGELARHPRIVALPEGTATLLPFATVQFDAPTFGGGPVALTLYWIAGYGGGLFLPFRDRTAGSGTYGGGRYLLDTIKGADLGSTEEGLLLDFNFAYNPSCAYAPRWTCPLAPQENRLPFPIPAGEKEFR